MCSATADFSNWHFLQALLCSFILLSILLAVSPMYTFPQEQGILYTTLDCCSWGRRSLAFVSMVLRDLPAPKTILMLYSWQTLLIDSLRPCVYGITTVVTGFCFSLSSWVSYMMLSARTGWDIHSSSALSSVSQSPISDPPP